MLGSHDALLLVDVQQDFLPGGRLAVCHGDQIVPVLKKWVDLFHRAGLTIFASRDWHPENHSSFKAQGGPWSAHCIAGTHGAELSPGLALPNTALIVDKGTRLASDAYSAFEGTDLGSRLKMRGIRRLFIAGLATEYCVLNTVHDAVRLGYEVVVLEDGIRALVASDGTQAITKMRSIGARMERWETFDAANKANLCEQ